MSEMETISWSVAQIFSVRRDRIDDELKGRQIGILTPMYWQRCYVEGKETTKFRPLFPGYLFFQQTETWGDVAEIEGVIRVLSKGLPIAGVEGARLTVQSGRGDFDKLEAPPAAAESDPMRKPRRRWKPSKKLRLRRAARRVAGQEGIAA